MKGRLFVLTNGEPTYQTVCVANAFTNGGCLITDDIENAFRSEYGPWWGALIDIEALQVMDMDERDLLGKLLKEVRGFLLTRSEMENLNKVCSLCSGPMLHAQEG